MPEVPKWFWQQFTQSASVYTVGEVFNGNMDYLAGYVGSVSGVLNYPFYYWVKDTFFGNKDMTNLKLLDSEWRRRLGQEQLQLLANFIDNHDNPRTLSGEATGNRDWSEKKRLYKAATTLTLTWTGIPIIYYGGEQYFAGGHDPFNREVLWNNLDTQSDLYRHIQTVNQYRKRLGTQAEPQVERFVDGDLYAFSRGRMFVAVTNRMYEVRREISYHPFPEGARICNIFYSQDCVLIKNGKFTLFLEQG